MNAKITLPAAGIVNRHYLIWTKLLSRHKICNNKYKATILTHSSSEAPKESLTTIFSNNTTINLYLISNG